MIYTLTLNPALDYVLRIPAVKEGETNRAATADLHFGGKGINVSLVLSELGVESTALGRTGTPEDIAPLAVFLAGEGASFITGQILGVDGGFAI